MQQLRAWRRAIRCDSFPHIVAIQRARVNIWVATRQRHHRWQPINHVKQSTILIASGLEQRGVDETVRTATTPAERAQRFLVSFIDKNDNWPRQARGKHGENLESNAITPKASPFVHETDN